MNTFNVSNLYDAMLTGREIAYNGSSVIVTGIKLESGARLNVAPQLIVALTNGVKVYWHTGMVSPFAFIN